MNYNYNSLQDQMIPSKKIRSKDGPSTRKGGLTSLQKFCAIAVFSLFGVSGLKAQTQLIPAGDGTFSNGSTFQENGWAVANEGTGPVKWFVGTAASGITAVGSTTSSNGTITLTAAADANITLGQSVYGKNIPSGAILTGISTDRLTLTLSTTATDTASNVTLGFGALPGAVSVATTQATSATFAALTYTVTLAAANPNISVGMAVAPIANVIDTNTYVAAINGTALVLSKPTINTGSLSSQTLVFTPTATNSAITGNAAYISGDNGFSNFYKSNSARTVYFYRDITPVAGQTAMTLTFDVKSSARSTATSTTLRGGWQVWVAPLTQNVVGADTQVTTHATYGVSWPGATLISFNADPQDAITRTTAFIPKSFVNTPFRLIFVWTNNTTTIVTPPASIDNISLVARTPYDDFSPINCAHSGLWSQPGTWVTSDGSALNIVPTPMDVVNITDLNGDNTARQVMIDSRYSGCDYLTMSGTNSLLQFVSSTNGVNDDFTINRNLDITGNAARFSNQDYNLSGRILKLAGNLNIGTLNTGSSSKFDSSTGRLTLNGSAPQTITLSKGTGTNNFFGNDSAALALNTFNNRAFFLNTLEVTNTSTTFPNVIWNVDGARIGTVTLTTGRVSVNQGTRVVLGNFTSPSMTIPQGYGFTDGTVSKWQSAAGTALQGGNEFPAASTDKSRYPFVTKAGLNRSIYFLADAAPSVAGEVAVTYADDATVSTVSVPDGSYNITNKYNGNWSFSTPDSKATGTSSILYTPNTTTNTFRVGAYYNGGFEAKDGMSRLMNASAAMPGTHQEGTTTPFAARAGLTLANLVNTTTTPPTAGSPIYVGSNDSSVLISTAGFVSAGSGDWNAPSTWVGNKVPGCNDVVTIATGHNVTVSTTANAAGVIISSGATLTHNANGNTITVGCTNNNSAFKNYGTYTMKSGTFALNGYMYHYEGSFFNHTGGDIIIDSNNNGDVATSVGIGGSSLKIETGNVNLTGGKITIVDPLVNLGSNVSVNSLSDFSVKSAGANGTFAVRVFGASNVNTPVGIGATQIYSDPNGQNGQDIFQTGMLVSGIGIPAGTTITAHTHPGAGGAAITLSNAVTAAIALPVNTTGDTTTGSSTIDNVASITGIAIGQLVTGAGIPDQTTVTAIGTTAPFSLTLSNNATATATAVGLQISSPVYFSAMTNTLNGIVVESNSVNSSLKAGQLISGTGITPGTTITSVQSINGLNSVALMQVVLSNPVSLTTPLSSQQTFNVSAVVPGSLNVILADTNPAIVKGALVSGNGIKPGTYVTDDLGNTGGVLVLSEPVQPGAPSPLVMNFQAFNTQTSGSFIYNSPIHVAAGLNHTLQIGDGVSKENTSIVTNGFNCQFQAGGGLLSLGNLTVDAPQTAPGLADRFMNVSGNGSNSNFNMNVQNAFTVKEGSVFKKSFYNSTVYLGGNLVNDGTINIPGNGVTFVMGNFINNAAVSTALPQTISGKGTFANNLFSKTTATFTAASLSALTVNNSSAAGVTLLTDNKFRVLQGVTMNTGILHTSDAHVLYVGDPDPTSTNNDNINGSNPASYVDGPVSMVIPTNGQNAANMNSKTLVLGTNGKSLPITLGTIGGAEFLVKVFDDNVGTVNTANATNKSTSRWSVTRVDTGGAFNTYQVGLGASDMTPYSTIVQSATTNGQYDLLATPAPVLTFLVPTTNKPVNMVTTPLSPGLPSSGFLGNFSYATAVTVPTGLCTGTPAPGNTLANGTATTLSVCAGQSVALTLASATTGSNVTYQWQSSIDGGTTWTDIAGATTATYSAIPIVNTSYRNNVNCSESIGTSNAVAITIAPSTITATGGTSCGGGQVSLTASGATNISWYDDSVTGNLVATGTTFSPVVSQTTTYYVAGSGTPTASTANPVNAIGGSAPTFAPSGTADSTLNAGIAFDVTKKVQLATVRVFPKNTAPVPVTVALYTSTGSIVSGTAPVIFTPTTVTGALGSVAQDVTLNYDIPAGAGYRLVVTNGLITTVNTLGNNGTTIPAYPQTVSSVILQGNVTSITGSPSKTANKTTYFHNLVFNEYCETARIPVIATVTTPAPTASAQSFCNSAMVADLGATGVAIKWYTTPSGGTALAPTTALETATYYTTQTTGGCESARTAVSVTVNTVAAPVATPQSFCNSATVADLVAAGTAIQWYAQQTGGMPLASTTALTTGTTYYASQTVNSCESARTAAVVTVQAVSAPTASDQLFCGSATVADLIATGTVIQWYSQQTGGMSLASTTALTTNTTYYASQTVNFSCESTRTPALVTVNPIPQAPTGDATQDACVTQTIADFTVVGTDLKWYDVANGGTPIPTSTPAVLNTTYYVSQTVNGCEGTRLAVLASGACLSVEDFSITQLNYYPNPVVDQLTITAKDMITRVELYNLLGQQLRVLDSNTDALQVDFKDFAPAAYLIKVYSEHKVDYFKVIKK